MDNFGHVLSEEMLNNVIIPKRVKDQKIIQLMDKMQDIVESVNRNPKDGDLIEEVLVVNSADIEKYGTSYVIRDLFLQGVCSIERWKLLPSSCFCLYVKKNYDNDK